MADDPVGYPVLCALRSHKYSVPEEVAEMGIGAVAGVVESREAAEEVESEVWDWLSPWNCCFRA